MRLSVFDEQIKRVSKVDLRLGVKYKKSYAMYHGYYGPRVDESVKSEGGFEINLGPKSYVSKDWGRNDIGGSILKGLSAKTVGNVTLGPKEDFVGIQTKIGVKTIFGLELDVKAGLMW